MLKIDVSPDSLKIIPMSPLQFREEMLRMRKDWIANPPAQPDNQGVNPMLPNDNNIVRIGGGELVLGCCKQTTCQ